MKTVFLLVFSIIVLFSFNNPIFGQEISIPGQIPELEEQISVIPEPKLPKPYEKVTIRLEAYGTDLSRAQITWKINNQIKLMGRGEVSLELNSGPTGFLQTVDIEIKPVGGPAIYKRLTFKPQEVDLLWEARSYTPPFYKGKAMPGYMGSVVAVAIPNFKSGQSAVSSANATFKWQHDDDVLVNESGFRKNSVTVKGGILLRPSEISVEAWDDAGNRAQKTLAIEYFEPFAAFYELSPIYGLLFNKAVSSANLNNREISLVTIPYFFETSNRSTLAYTWRVNGNESFLFNSDTATFRYRDDDEGISMIDALIKHRINYLQEARARSSIRLPKSESIFEF